jgi:hypothetical protein
MAGILMARYQFEDWDSWDAELNDATEQFYAHFGVHPNLMGGEPEPVEEDGPVTVRRYHVA